MSTTTAEGQRVMELHGQRVVILGGTSGIGLATAREMYTKAAAARPQPDPPCLDCRGY